MRSCTWVGKNHGTFHFRTSFADQNHGHVDQIGAIRVFVVEMKVPHSMNCAALTMSSAASAASKLLNSLEEDSGVFCDISQRNPFVSNQHKQAKEQSLRRILT